MPHANRFLASQVERLLCPAALSWHLSEALSLSLSRRISGDFGRAAGWLGGTAQGWAAGAAGSGSAGAAVTPQARSPALLRCATSVGSGERLPSNESQEFPAQGSDCSRAEPLLRAVFLLPLPGYIYTPPLLQRIGVL